MTTSDAQRGRNFVIERTLTSTAILLLAFFHHGARVAGAQQQSVPREIVVVGDGGPGRHPERAERAKGSLSRHGSKSLGWKAILSSLRSSV